MMDSAFQFDALEEAKSEWWASTHKGGTEHEALNSIAASLIALAEQSKPRFVQVGEMAYNLDQIQLVNMYGNTIGIWFQNHPEHDGPTLLEGSDATAFLKWWNQNADVVRLGKEED